MNNCLNAVGANWVCKYVVVITFEFPKSIFELPDWFSRANIRTVSTHAYEQASLSKLIYLPSVYLKYAFIP